MPCIDRSKPVQNIQICLLQCSPCCVMSTWTQLVIQLLVGLFVNFHVPSQRKHNRFVISFVAFSFYPNVSSSQYYGIVDFSLEREIVILRSCEQTLTMRRIVPWLTGRRIVLHWAFSASSEKFVPCKVTGKKLNCFSDFLKWKWMVRKVRSPLVI